MPRAIGFSTGSLAGRDFQAALSDLSRTTASAVELSALREDELEVLLAALPDLDLSRFRYVSFHAPSALRGLTPVTLVERLLAAIDPSWPIIVHADLITSAEPWMRLGDRLFIENMDKRKPSGRTAGELHPLFEWLPAARFCLDFAHARQVDPSLCEVVWLLTEFRDRIGQLHVSELNTQSRHEPLSFAAISAIEAVKTLIPTTAPIILEFAAAADDLQEHLRLAEQLFPASGLRVPRAAAS